MLMKLVKPNDRGDDVRRLQELLAARGFPLAATDRFDAATFHAVIDFQTTAGLKKDGVVGYRTWEALLFAADDAGGALSEEDFGKAAVLLDVEVAALKAVKEVETGKFGAFMAPGKPAMLFEGHIFWSQLSKRGIPPGKLAKGNEDILYPKADASRYKGGLGEYDRLERALAINREAALCSASWGMFQIMGFNHAACGVSDVKAFVQQMQQGETRQLVLSLRFIHAQKEMEAALRARNWPSFARYYNGPLYRQNLYDEKLRAAYEKYSAAPS